MPSANGRRWGHTDSRLPRLLLLTDRHACEARGRTLMDTVRSAVAGGVRAVVLREKDLAEDQRRRLGAELGSLLEPVTGTLIVASDPALAAALGARGVHLAASDQRPPKLAGKLVGRSCHDGAAVRRAAAEGDDYVTISPVFPTRSKPGYGPPLGFAGLSRMVLAVPGLSLYALGGVDASSAAACLAAGAAGVAVMGAVMAANDPETSAQELVAAVAAAVTR
ncbi:MAG: thiamine phosphate synthase [Candidatus Dormiibacterota bacterium]